MGDSLPYRSYDPLRHLLFMGVTVEYVDGLPEPGLYYHAERRVEIRAGMSPVKERCVLAHEAAHCEYGHMPSEQWCAVQKMERLANAMAGRRLIDFHKMAELQAAGVDEKTMCQELGVLPVVLRAYLWLSAPAWRLAA